MPSDVDDDELHTELSALAGELPADWALERLAARRVETVVPALLAALADESLGGVGHGRILILLARVAPGQAYRPVLAGLADPRQQVRWAARDALAAIPGAEATRALVGLLDDPSADTVMHVAGLLGNRRYPDAVPPLAGLLTHPDPLIRCAAAQALAEISGTEARRALAGRLPAEPDPAVRSAIEAALG